MSAEEEEVESDESEEKKLLKKCTQETLKKIAKEFGYRLQGKKNNSEIVAELLEANVTLAVIKKNHEEQVAKFEVARQQFLELQKRNRSAQDNFKVGQVVEWKDGPESSETRSSGVISKLEKGYAVFHIEGEPIAKRVQCTKLFVSTNPPPLVAAPPVQPPPVKKLKIIPKAPAPVIVKKAEEDEDEFDLDVFLRQKDRRSR